MGKLLAIYGNQELSHAYSNEALELLPQWGIIPGMRYCCAITNNPSKTARMMLWKNVRRIIKPSFPTIVVVETPVVTFWGDII